MHIVHIYSQRVYVSSHKFTPRFSLSSRKFAQVRGWFADGSRKFASKFAQVRGQLADVGWLLVRASSRKFADGSRKFAGGSRGSRTFTITIYDSSRMVLEVLTDGSQRFAASSRKFPSVLD